MREIRVTRCKNGWIIRKDMEETVYINREDMLLEVYRSMCEWSVYDRVQVVTT